MKERIYFRSTALRTIEYDHKNKILLIQFKKPKAKYYYMSIPKKLFTLLKKAPSKGKFYNKNIKGQFAAFKKRF